MQGLWLEYDFFPKFLLVLLSACVRPSDDVIAALHLHVEIRRGDISVCHSLDIGSFPGAEMKQQFLLFPISTNRVSPPCPMLESVILVSFDLHYAKK